MNLIKTHKERFLAIDANAIVHRAFHAYPSTLQTEDGIQVNAVYGFTVMLLSALKTFDPKYVLCCFDTSAPTFRHEEYPEYKGTRKPTDQSLIDQFPLVEEILKAFNIPIIKKEGFEADDLLGTISKYVSSGKWSEKNLELYILSGDRDLLQLVNDDVKVCLPAGNFKNLVEYDRGGTYRYLGMYPEQVVDFKAIAGDSSDNIPGVKGVGAKTVVELLSKYGDMDNIYRNLKDIKPRYANLLVEGIEQAELSRMLAKIEQEVGVVIHLEEALLKDFEKDKVVEIFKQFGFKSLISRLDEIKEDEKGSYTNQLDIFATSVKEIVWSDMKDIENVMTNASKLYIACIGEEESGAGHEFFAIRSVDNKGLKVDFLTKDFSSTVKANCETVLYGLENNVSHLSAKLLPKTYDIGLFAHTINSERRGYTLHDLSFDYATQTVNEKLLPSDLPQILDALEEISQNQIQKANQIQLYPYTKQNIQKYLQTQENHLQTVLTKVEIPISYILDKMEKRGIAVNIQKLEKLDQELSKQISQLSQQIYETVGHEFNINSPKQLADILFNELSLPIGKKITTKESVLQELKGLHPAIEKILEYRELTKMHSTYTTPLLQMAKENEQNSIHTDFKQTGTTSGRLSSTNPNMQNIPLQGKWAEELRTTFISRKGHKLIAMDYSQMELRIMADISKDDLLIKDFEQGLDIHKSTASRILDKEMEDVTKEERSLGKTINFGILFGQTAYGLAKMMNIPAEQASEYIRNYFEHYKGVEEYIRELEKEAYKRGYVQTMLGTTRYIRGVRSRNIRMMKAAQREAVNMPIQGTEADIMKLAMIEIDKKIQEKYQEKAFIILQIHDELIFEVQDNNVENFIKDAKNIMENIVQMEVPFQVSSSIGNNMSELK